MAAILDAQSLDANHANALELDTGLLDQIVEQSRVAKSSSEHEHARDIISELVTQVMEGTMVVSSNLSATIDAFVAGALLLAAFVSVELRAEEPITPLRLFSDRSRTSANIARGLMFAGMFGLFFFLTQYLQDVLHYSALKAGFAFLPMPTTVFVVSQVTSRRLADLVPPRVLMLGGIALGTTGFVLASQLGEHASYLHVFGCLILFAIGNGMAFVPLTNAALVGVPPKDAGAASGLVNVTQQLGGALGVAVLVTVAGSATKHAGGSPTHAFVVGATHAFAGAALFLLAALVLVGALVRPARTSH